MNRSYTQAINAEMSLYEPVCGRQGIMSLSRQNKAGDDGFNLIQNGEFPLTPAARLRGSLSVCGKHLETITTVTETVQKKGQLTFSVVVNQEHELKPIPENKMAKVTNSAISTTFMQKHKVEEKVEESGRRTQSERWRRGGLKGRLQRCCSPVSAPHTIPRDTPGNGFRGGTITVTASPDAQLLQVALSKQTCDTSRSVHRTHARANFPPFEALISFAVHPLENRQIRSHTCFLHWASVPTPLQPC